LDTTAICTIFAPVIQRMIVISRVVSFALLDIQTTFCIWISLASVFVVFDGSCFIETNDILSVRICQINDRKLSVFVAGWLVACAVNNVNKASVAIRNGGMLQCCPQTHMV
jgi:hypothetical protein